MDKIQQTNENCCCACTTYVVLGVLSLILYLNYKIYSKSNKEKPGKDKIVLITGCDSGLGFSLAQHAYELGFTVIATCLNLESKGATTLHQDIVKIRLDVTKKNTITQTLCAVEHLINTNGAKLWALVNNAGVMTFGEFEWQTDELIQQQVSVNLLGTFLVTKAFSPLLRKSQGRIINVTSHCSSATLPGLSVYGATKSAVTAWSEALRMELKKYGVKVTTLVPGSFVTQSKIMANHTKQVEEMYARFSEEQREFYGDYFQRYNAYLKHIPSQDSLRKIEDFNLYELFENALLNDCLKFEYKNESFRYWFFHTIFQILPTCLRDEAMKIFMKMPQYIPRKQE